MAKIVIFSETFLTYRTIGLDAAEENKPCSRQSDKGGSDFAVAANIVELEKTPCTVLAILASFACVNAIDSAF
ncbi:MAG: hypothetical protein CMA91_04820 [Euryarchaeota archaeon]|nr:hypothetical protein [Euryarchaeota archaeon]